MLQNILYFLQVKRIMNSVYKDLREQFEADELYAGSEVLATILNAIKVCDYHKCPKNWDTLNYYSSQKFVAVSVF